MKKLVVLSYHGGLGDVLYTLMKDQFRYNILDDLEPNERAVVYLVCPNPGSAELFSHHPKKDQIDLKYLPWTIAGTPVTQNWQFWTPRPSGNTTCKWKKTWNSERMMVHPTQEDLEALAPIDGRKYVVVSATAAGPERNLSPELIDLVTKKILERNMVPVFVGKSYKVHGEYPYVYYDKNHKESKPDHPEVVDVIDKTTLLGSLHAIENAAGLVCCYSAMTAAGLILKKKQFFLCPRPIRDTFIGRAPWVPELLDNPLVLWACWEDEGYEQKLEQYLDSIK